MIDNNANRKQPFCDWCDNDIGILDYYYTANPPGGYGMREHLICERCIDKSENADVSERIRGKVSA